MIYKLSRDGLGQESVLNITEQGTKVIPFNPENSDYRAFLAWCAEGNTPLPADEQTN